MSLRKKIFWSICILFVLIQIFRPTRNDNTEITADHIAKLYPMPDDVAIILDKACNDCHTNNTEYPWYAEIQPFAWWLSSHINDGKRHFNMSDFGNYNLARQYHKLEECVEQIKAGEMPLKSYTWIHKDAILSDSEKAKLYAWFNGIRDSMKAKYPADSLIRKKK